MNNRLLRNSLVHLFSTFFFQIGVIGFFCFLKYSWLQCCANFCYIAKWLSYMHIYILFCILFHYPRKLDIVPCAIYTVGSCCLSILYVAMCVPANPKLLFIPPLFSSPSHPQLLLPRWQLPQPRPPCPPAVWPALRGRGQWGGPVGPVRLRGTEPGPREGDKDTDRERLG